MVKEHNQDQFMEKLDEELRMINRKLKSVLSKTEALLKECSKEREEAETGDSAPT